MTYKALLSCAAVMASVASMAAAGGKYDPFPMPAPVAPPPPPPPAYDWTGGYAGIHLGGARGEIELRDLDEYNSDGFSYTTDTDIIAGVQLGYNVQNGSLVYGVEADLGYLGLDDSAQYPPFVGDPAREDDSVAAIKTRAYGTLTGRAGFAANNALFYAKGGIAAARAEVSFTDPNPTGLILVDGTSAKDTMIGWTLGGGIEYGVSRNLTVKAEYLYMDLGDISHTATSEDAQQQQSSHTFRHDVTVHTLKAGVNYRF